MKLKLKSSKSALKRFKVSSRGKLQHRRTRMNHFNAKDSGNERRRKRLQRPLAGQDRRGIGNLIPYI